MLNIYYTGADKSGEVQAEASRSLGGLISSSAVPNDFLGNIFPTISQLSQQETRKETRVIAVQNNTGSTFTSFTVYINCIDPEDSAAEWELGYMVAALDDCADLRVEELPNPYSSPLNVTMETGTGPNNKVTLANLADKQYLGLYIKRKITAVVVDEEADEQMADDYDDGVTSKTEEEIDLVFSWA